MNGTNPVEVTYANGKIYKECYQTSKGNNSVTSKRLDDGCVSSYFLSKSYSLDKLDKNFPFFSGKKYANGDRVIKSYHPSKDIYKIIEGEDTSNGKDLSGYDLCPNVVLWVGIGLYKGIEESYDLIFAVDNDEQLRNISEYYNLDYPLPDDKSLDINVQDWHSYDFDAFCEKVNPNCNSSLRKDFKYGSIKFKNNKPSLLKMYESNYKGVNYA